MRSQVVGKEPSFTSLPVTGLVSVDLEGMWGQCVCMYIFSLYSANAFGYSFLLSLNFPVILSTDCLS